MATRPKVLFTNPPWWVEKLSDPPKERWLAGVRAGSRWPFTQSIRSAPDRLVPGDYLPYPFFLGYAAAYARKSGEARVEFRDSLALRESYESWFAFLEEGRYDYLVVESGTPSWEHDRDLLRRVRERWPHLRLVVVGPIASTRSEEILGELGAHGCVQGEYEKGVLRILQGATGLLGHDLLTREEMNAAPFPWFDDLHAHLYWDPNPRGQVAPQAQVWSSRGCPYKCIFCVWPATMTGHDPDGSAVRTVRHYTPEYMEAFLTEIVERHGFRSIYFDDDTFNLGNRHVLGMCEVMARLGLPWSAMCRADTIPMDTWRVMREAGCLGVKLGIESGNQWVLDHIVNKHLDLDRARAVVHELKRLGMTVHGTFTYGLPGETREQRLDTRRFIESLPFDTVQESGTAEIEGTPLATLRSRGHLDAYDGARMDPDFRREVDGLQKFKSMAAELRES